MKKIIFITMFFLCFTIFSQQKFYFHLELSNLNEKPIITENIDGTLTLITNRKEVSDIFKKYKIYKFERYCTNCKSQNLLNTFEVECNNIDLMNKLHSSAPSIFINVEQYQAPQLLYTPNDYGTLPPFTIENFEPRMLDMINAKQAWDITHSRPNILIGINEYGVSDTNPDLINKVLNPAPCPNYANCWHATGVAGIAGGDTNNSAGLSSIGFDSSMVQGNINSMVGLGAKVINMSWGLPYISTRTNPVPDITSQNLFNDLSDNSNIVFVAAAGNACGGNATASFLTSNGLAINAENYAIQRHFPASYKNVISVSTVGNWNEPYSTVDAFDNWKDIHKIKTRAGAGYSGTYPPIMIIEPETFHQHNDSIDIVVPAYRQSVLSRKLSVATGGPWNSEDYQDTFYGIQSTWSGTSFSAPIVCGAIALMQSVNYCLKPKEVESILKLTAVNIENMPENLEFHGKLGGGRLDAFKAVEMANEMAKTFGTVNVADRILYRRWFYKLETAPYEIKMFNNLVTDEAKIKFWARNNIEITSGDYKPSTGYVDLQINSNLVLNNCSPPIALKPESSKISLENQVSSKLKLFPNPNEGIFTITNNEKENKNIKIEIFDIFGKSIFNTLTSFINTAINIENYPDGMYIVKITSDVFTEVLKFIKE